MLRKKLKNNTKVEHRSSVTSVKTIKTVNNNPVVDSDTGSTEDPEQILKTEQEARIKKIEGMVRKNRDN